MTRSKKQIQELLENAQQLTGSGVQLYLITRDAGSGIKRGARIAGRYRYNLHEVRLDAKLRMDFLKIATDQLKRFLSKEDLEIKEYEAIDDDSEKLLTFALKKRGLPFAEMVRDQINSIEPKKVANNLYSLVDQVWAYGLVLRRGNEPPLIAFRRMPKTKLTVDAKDNAGAIGKFFLTQFMPNRSMLERFEGTTVGFDKKVDCVLYGETFYIFSKPGFEHIAGLEEEFMGHANNTLQFLEDTDLIEGLDHLRLGITKSTNMMKRIARLSNDPRLLKITRNQIAIWEAFAKKRKQNLKIKDNKILIEDKKDVDLLVQLLNDYFVESPNTGILYGAFAKQNLA